VPRRCFLCVRECALSAGCGSTDRQRDDDAICDTVYAFNIAGLEDNARDIHGSIPEVMGVARAAFHISLTETPLRWSEQARTHNVFTADTTVLTLLQ